MHQYLTEKEVDSKQNLSRLLKNVRLLSDITKNSQTLEILRLIIYIFN